MTLYYLAKVAILFFNEYTKHFFADLLFTSYNINYVLLCILLEIKKHQKLKSFLLNQNNVMEM